jgi:hypothetical protein
MELFFCSLSFWIEGETKNNFVSKNCEEHLKFPSNPRLLAWLHNQLRRLLSQLANKNMNSKLPCKVGTYKNNIRRDALLTMSVFG